MQYCVSLFVFKCLTLTIFRVLIYILYMMFQVFHSDISFYYNFLIKFQTVYVCVYNISLFSYLFP